MATTAIWNIKDRLDRVINYAVNPEKTENMDFQELHNVLEYTQEDAKTEQQFYVTGINCQSAIACEQMSHTKLQHQKTGGILAFHGYQAFAPGEATPETAHTIGVKLAEELWGDRFEVLVATHLDKHHLHNHFVLNSVSCKDGKKFYANIATYAKMRKTSDKLCREYSLSVIENPKSNKSSHYAEWKTEQEGKPTWRGLIRADVDSVIAASMTFTQFIAALQKQGYEVKTNRKYMAVRPPGKERFVRLKTLGDDYTEEAIKQRLLQNRIPKKPEVLPEPKPKHGRLKGPLKPAIRLTGLQALYFHYLYKMGILPRTRASAKRMHFLLREDIRYMDTLIAQTRLLGKNQIETREQLTAYQTGLEKEIDALCNTRNTVYNRIRRCNYDDEITEYKLQIAGLSKQISSLRREVKLCIDILDRSDEMQEKLSQVYREENKQRKEDKNHVPQRGGRPNRQHES